MITMRKLLQTSKTSKTDNAIARATTVKGPTIPSIPKSTAASKSTSHTASTHTIQVGNKKNPHQYSPSSVNASVGDTILFEFWPTNHSVARADYLAPCVPASTRGFWSGMFNSFDTNSDGQLQGKPPTWELKVNDTEPMFFYCTAINSCMKNGMIGAINPNRTMTWESQHKRAIQYPVMLVPGQTMPAEGQQSSSPTSSASSPSSMRMDMGMSLSYGEITGIVIGCVAFVGILVALVFFVGRNRTYQAWVAFLKSNEIRGAQLPVPQGPVAPKAMDPAAPDFNFAPPQYQSPVFPVQYTQSLVSMTQARTPEIWTWARSHISPLELEGNSNSRAAQSPRELDSNSSAHLLVGNAKHSE